MASSIKRGKTAGGLVYHEYDPGDGYVYRQYKDGSILIVKSPRGGAGTLVTEDGPTAKAWFHINNQIGELKAGRRDKAIQLGLSVVNAAVGAIPKKHKGKHKKMIKQPKMDPVPDVPEEEGTALPWIPIAIGGVVLVGALAMSGSGKGG